MGDKLKSLVKTAGADNAEAKKEYKGYLKIGQVIGEGIAYELFDKEGAKFPAFAKNIGSAVQNAASKGKDKVVAGAKSLGKSVRSATKKVQEKSVSAAKKVDEKAQSLGNKILQKKNKSGGLHGTVKKRRQLGYGTAAAVGTAGIAGVAGAAKSLKKKGEEGSTDVENGQEKTAEVVPLSDFILRYETVEGE